MSFTKIMFASPVDTIMVQKVVLEDSFGVWLFSPQIFQAFLLYRFPSFGVWASKLNTCLAYTHKMNIFSFIFSLRFPTYQIICSVYYQFVQCTIPKPSDLLWLVTDSSTERICFIHGGRSYTQQIKQTSYIDNLITILVNRIVGINSLLSINSIID